MSAMEAGDCWENQASTRQFSVTYLSNTHHGVVRWAGSTGYEPISDWVSGGPGMALSVVLNLAFMGQPKLFSDEKWRWRIWNVIQLGIIVCMVLRKVSNKEKIWFAISKLISLLKWWIKSEIFGCPNIEISLVLVIYVMESLLFTTMKILSLWLACSISEQLIYLLKQLNCPRNFIEDPFRILLRYFVFMTILTFL